MSATRRRRRQTIEKPVTTGQHTSELYERLRARQTRTVVVQHEVEQSDEIDHESHRYQECAETTDWKHGRSCNFDYISLNGLES